ncbi:hypothetical protein BDZ97DRAFT_1759716 [Flammula alnicola]|nr:hypothetical protein BDZ97DRAFT_1759716 [Flammula alnicola]
MNLLLPPTFFPSLLLFHLMSTRVHTLDSGESSDDEPQEMGWWKENKGRPQRKGKGGSNARVVPEVQEPWQPVEPEVYLGDPTEQEVIDNVEISQKYGPGASSNATNQSQNDFLREWVPRRPDYLKTILAMEAPWDPMEKCEACDRRAGKWRCKQCAGGRMLCGLCFQNEHQFLPFHRVETWNGRYFKVGALWQVGVKLYLGHHGLPCPGSVTRPRETEQSDGIRPRPTPAATADAGFEGDMWADPEIPVAAEGDDDDDDDVDVMEAPTTAHPSTLPRPPPYDNHGNPFITIVDVSGIHHLPVIGCLCNDADSDMDIAYLKMGLFPTSFIRIQTVFTFNVLKDYRLSNLECKTSSYQYYQKLRRCHFPQALAAGTNDGAPPTEPTAWWKPDGRGQCTSGKLASFCPACPQPGVNLPANWQDDPHRELYTRVFTADGNFKAEHLTPKNEADDVHLTHGEGFMTAPGPYQEQAPRYTRRLVGHRCLPPFGHRRHPPSGTDKPACNSHRAVLDGEKSGPGKRARGIGANACARHGCFCPSSVVDFQKDDRFYDHTGLTLPQGIAIVKAIGLFHVHGHKDDCLPRYATTYIPGLGVIDGEILETLWAVLNAISRSLRSATTAHRTEVVDDHMGDSNWKKTINMASTIVNKYERAVKEQEKVKNTLMNSPRPVLRTYSVWKREIEQAEARRQEDVKSMDYMNLKVDKPLTRREIELKLSEKELHTGGQTGQAAWISKGLKIEESQFELRDHVRKLGRRPTTAQKLELANKRRQLKNRIRAFTKTGIEYLGEDAEDSIYAVEEVVVDDDVSEEDDNETENATISAADPEGQILPFPSAIPEDFIATLPAEHRAVIAALRQNELDIREGHGDDALDLVRTAVIHLSWQFKNKVRTARSGVQTTRAWDQVKLLNRTWKLHRRVYNHNRTVMMTLGDHDTVAIKYPFLELEHCRISTTISNPNSAGQSRDRLPWFWSSSARLVATSATDTEHQNEFYRVNWLRARAQNNRWAEELNLTKHEMQWTVRWYVHMAEKWKARRDPAVEVSRGHRAYAEKQMAMWNELGRFKYGLTIVPRSSVPKFKFTVILSFTTTMPLPHLVSPPPDARMPISYEDREASARLKLHLLMARLRTAIRTVMSRDRNWKILNWKQNIQDEAEQVLTHVGFCTVNGFRIQIPYLLKDLSDMILETNPPRQPEANTLPASINMDFNADQDVEILGCTKDYCYWWKSPVSEAEVPRVNRQIIQAHFKDFFTTVTHKHMAQMEALGSTRNIQHKNIGDVPGLAARPPPPAPLAPPANATHGTPEDLSTPAVPGSAPTCRSCAPLRETLLVAFDRLQSVQTRVNGAVILGKEAAERSAARVGAYNILDQVYSKHGIPFQDGDSLPEEYQNIFPRHEHHDGILNGIKLRAQAKQQASAEAEGPWQSDGSPSAAGRPANSAASNTNDSEAESVESIPSQFRSHDSDGSDEHNLSNDDSEGDSGNWELDAEGEVESENSEQEYDRDEEDE